MLRCFIPLIPVFIGCRTRGEPPSDLSLERDAKLDFVGGLLASDDPEPEGEPAPRGDASLPTPKVDAEGAAEGGGEDTAAVDPADTGDAPETETGQAAEGETGEPPADTAAETGEAPADTGGAR